MITGYYCTNIFSEQAKELIAFYREILDIPFIKTDDDNSNGVYLSFVFQTNNLDLTMECLKGKGISLSEAIRYDWRTYEVRLNDLDGNEIVLAEFA